MNNKRVDPRPLVMTHGLEISRDLLGNMEPCQLSPPGSISIATLCDKNSRVAILQGIYIDARACSLMTKLIILLKKINASRSNR